MKMFVLLSICIVSFWSALGDAKLIKNVPTDGIGNLLISVDDNHDEYNTDKIMVLFDLNCLGDSNMLDREPNLHFGLNDNDDQTSMVNSIIDNHYPCLSHEIDSNFQHYHTGRGISFLNVNDNGNCIKDKSVQLDYNNHCIDMFSYEPLFRLNSIHNYGKGYEKKTNEDYTCLTQSTTAASLPGTSAWHLDQFDSYASDNQYTYPNIDS